MKMMLIGLFFILFQFDVKVGNATVGLLPDFLGYALLAVNLGRLKSESRRFARIRPLAAGMGIFTGILYLLDLVGFSSGMSYAEEVEISHTHLLFLLVAGVVTTFLSLYILFCIVRGIQAVELRAGVELNGEKLKTSCTGLSVFLVLTWFFALLIPQMALFCGIGYFAFAVAFLVSFNKTSVLYSYLPGNF